MSDFLNGFAKVAWGICILAMIGAVIMNPLILLFIPAYLGITFLFEWVMGGNRRNN